MNYGFDGEGEKEEVPEAEEEVPEKLPEEKVPEEKVLEEEEAPEEEEAGKTYFVEKLRKRTFKKVPYLLVKWVEDEETSWETVEHMKGELGEEEFRYHMRSMPKRRR